MSLQLLCQEYSSGNIATSCTVDQSLALSDQTIPLRFLRLSSSVLGSWASSMCSFLAVMLGSLVREDRSRRVRFARRSQQAKARAEGCAAIPGRVALSPSQFVLLEQASMSRTGCRTLKVEAYSSKAADETFATTIPWQSSSSRPFGVPLPPRASLQFLLRICPPTLEAATMLSQSLNSPLDG